MPLNLTRRDGEKVMIECPDGALITVSIFHKPHTFDNGMTRNLQYIAVDAPKDFAILREELYNKG